MSIQGLRGRLLYSAIALLLLAGLLISACRPAATPTPAPTPTPGALASPTPTPIPKPSGELRFAVSTLYNEIFHPLRASMTNNLYQRMMYDSLIGSDDEGNLSAEESIAYKWEEAADHMSWTFYIRQGIVFHNGDALTPEDVKFTFEQDIAPENISSWQPEFKARIDRVAVAPPDKVVVYLKKPWPTILYYLSPRMGSEALILPKNYLQKVGEPTFLRNPVGSGPYKLLDHVDGSYIRFEAVDYPHWRTGVPKFKYVTYLLVKEEGTRLAMLKTGEVDIIEVSRAKAPEAESAGFRLHGVKGGLFVDLIYLRQFKADTPLSKLQVRQALAYAIDKEKILQTLLKGKGSLVGLGDPWFTWGLSYKPFDSYPFNPTKAKELLAEAGYPKGFDLYVYSFVSTLPEQAEIMETLAAYWDAIGLKTHILKMDYASFRPIWANTKEPPGPAVHVFSWPNRPMEIWRTMVGSKQMFSQTADPEADRLIDQFEAQASLDAYIQASRTLADYAYKNLFAYGLFEVDTLYGANDKVPADWKLGMDVYEPNLEYIYRTKWAYK